jgi:hypothetical protein
LSSAAFAHPALAAILVSGDGSTIATYYNCSPDLNFCTYVSSETATYSLQMVSAHRLDCGSTVGCGQTTTKGAGRARIQVAGVTAEGRFDTVTYLGAIGVATNTWFLDGATASGTVTDASGAVFPALVDFEYWTLNGVLYVNIQWTDAGGVPHLIFSSPGSGQVTGFVVSDGSLSVVVH